MLYYSISIDETIITVENNEEFAELLSTDRFDEDKQTLFAIQNRGKIIEFDCVVLDERIDEYYNSSYVLVPGENIDDFKEVFFYLDRIDPLDYGWETRQVYFEAGTRIRLRAEIVSGDYSMYIYLKPVKTWSREE